MEQMLFETKEAFRSWLQDNCLTSKGIWLTFGKKGGPKTLSASEALEEALCYGWIDGQMKSIDDKTYQKYFAIRRKGSEWSEKNKSLVNELEAQGRMTEYGRAKILEAQQSGNYEARKREVITDDIIGQLEDKLQGHEPAYSNYRKMSPSVKKIYAALYNEPKSEATRVTRLEKIIGRLDQNLKPM